MGNSIETDLQLQTTSETMAAVASTKPFGRSSFKYYIHDSADSCRLQLIGEFGEAQVTELDGCWVTAKTTLKNRKLVLDLRSVTAVDDAGKRWLAGMAQEGAIYQPETFLRDAMAGRCASSPVNPPVKLTLRGRLLEILRCGAAASE